MVVMDMVMVMVMGTDKGMGMDTGTVMGMGIARNLLHSLKIKNKLLMFELI